VGGAILDTFVVLEGLDGAGTTTQLELLERRLDREGVRGHCTCEPTEGPVGLLIRSALRREIRVQPRTLAILFAADRWEHLHAPGTGIVDRVRDGEVVASDRYLFSSLAYQGVAWSLAGVLELHRDYPLPAAVIYIDTPVDVCQQRLSGRSGRDLFDATAMQRRVAQGYARAFEAFASTALRVHRLDGLLPPEEIGEQVWKVVAGLPIIKA
jgi:dTMP kinase